MSMRDDSERTDIQRTDMERGEIERGRAGADTAVERRSVERGAVERGTVQSEQSALLADDTLEGFQERWDEVQATFVDDPRSAIEQADRLVQDVMRQMTETFRRERESLEGQWGGGSDADTEQLRVALQRYRSFFRRLLAR